MQTVAILSKEERKELFLASSVKMKVNQAIIEKDFWVCWTLDQIFQVSRFSNIFAFKGGTSLSKAYNLIDRFSEDIDLILDWRVLGYEKEEPWKERSNTKQEKFNKEANIRTVEFLKKNSFLLSKIKFPRNYKRIYPYGLTMSKMCIFPIQSVLKIPTYCLRFDWKLDLWHPGSRWK